MLDRTERVARALAWAWLTDGDDDSRRGWMEKAAEVIDLPTTEAVARRLCKLNGNCFGYRNGKLTDLCPTDDDCRCWGQWSDYAKAVMSARAPQ